jgi:hypothetical protein
LKAIEDADQLTLLWTTSTTSPKTQKGKEKSSMALLSNWRTFLPVGNSAQAMGCPKGRSKHIVKDRLNSPPPIATVFKEEEIGGGKTNGAAAPS